MTTKPITIAQRIFREWCAAHGACVDVMMAGDLINRIETAIIDERNGQRTENDAAGSYGKDNACAS